MPIYSSPITSDPLNPASKTSPSVSPLRRSIPSHGFTSPTPLKSSPFHFSLPPSPSSPPFAYHVSCKPTSKVQSPSTTTTKTTTTIATTPPFLHDPCFVHLRNRVYAYNQYVKLASHSPCIPLLKHASASTSCSSSRSISELHCNQSQKQEQGGLKKRSGSQMKSFNSKTQSQHLFFHAGV